MVGLLSIYEQMEFTRQIKKMIRAQQKKIREIEALDLPLIAIDGAHLQLLIDLQIAAIGECNENIKLLKSKIS